MAHIIDQTGKVRFKSDDKPRQKDSGVLNQAIPPHGNNALFNTPGLDPNVISAVVQPMPGLQGFLLANGHVQRSMYSNPIFAILTGQTASTGTNPTSSCDTNAKSAGNLKIARQSRTFGEITRLTKPVSIDRSGMLINRSEMLDLRLVNNPFAELPDLGIASTPDSLFQNAMAKSVLEELNALNREYGQLIYTGNPANTAASTGGYLEFAGLDIQYNTGLTDFISGVAAPAMDSLMYDFGGAIVQNSAASIVRIIVETVRDRIYLSKQVGLDPVTFGLGMRYQLFLALTEVWPCVFETYRCDAFLPSNTTGYINLSDQNTMRNEMRMGEYLLVDGMKVPVILDDYQPELNAGAGNFQSDIYVHPIKTGAMSGADGQLLYLDYFNYRGPEGAYLVTQKVGPTDEYRVTPDGRFIVHFPGGTVFCKQAYIRTSYRVIQRAPFLAARLQNLRYNVLFHERSPFPGTSFNQNGGATSFSRAY